MIVLADCVWCPARLSMLLVRRQGVAALEFTEDAWQHLTDRHSAGAVGAM